MSEHLRQLCSSFIEPDRAVDGEVLIIYFKLGNQKTIKGIFVRELLFGLAVFLHFLIERLNQVLRRKISPNGFQEMVEAGNKEGEIPVVL